MHPSTIELIECFEDDLSPSLATKIQFGLDDDDFYDRFMSLKWAYNNKIVDIKGLEAARGDGDMLTEIAYRSHDKLGGNPHTCEFIMQEDMYQYYEDRQSDIDYSNPDSVAH